MKDHNELESVVIDWLDEIKSVPHRNLQAASRGRAQFLDQAVSASATLRHNGWISKFRKEHFAMNTIISTLLILGLLFGGGATVNAAQDDLPNEPLYRLKLWSEDLSLQFQNNDEAKVDRLMELTQLRVQEMIQLAETGEVIPDQVKLRLEQHIQQTLQICSTMDDATLERTLLQIHDRLQQHDRDLEQLQLHTQDQTQLLTQTRTMLRERLQLVEDGLTNHEAFRNGVQNGFQYGQDEDLASPVQNGNGQQDGQPTLEPNGPNTDPGGPNLEPNDPNTDSGGPNPDSNNPNNEPGNPNFTPGGPNTDPGSGTGNNESGGNNKK